MTMYDLSREIGVKSFSFRQIPNNADVAAVALRCGVSTVDLSGCHVDYDAPASWPGVIASYRDAGVRLPGIGVVYTRPDEAWNRRFFEFARLAGTKLVSFSFPPEEHEKTLRLMERLAEEYGVRLAIHNHGGYNWLGSIEVLRWIFKQTSPRIGLMLDTAWALHTGQSAASYVKAFGNRLWGVHLKDFAFDAKGKWRDATIGSGTLNLPELKQALIDVGFDGEPILEFEGDPRNPVPALSKCVDIIRQEFA